MTEVVWINGHDPECAYIRGLHDVLEEHFCDCADLRDDEYPPDEES